MGMGARQIMNRKPAIILIDTDRLLLDLLRNYLKSGGADVLVASSSITAMEALDQAGPAAAVIAINPKTPGCQALPGRAREWFPDSLILALVDSDDMAESAKSLGLHVLDKREHLTAALDRFLLAAGLQAPSRNSSERVLIVDDEDLIREFLSTFLESRGYAATEARNGEEALRLLRADSGFGVVLLDIMMPLKGGMEVLSEIRRFRRPPAVIMMTALADSEIAQKALRTGAFNYILKPLNLSEIESNVSACFSRRAHAHGGMTH